MESSVKNQHLYLLFKIGKNSVTGKGPRYLSKSRWSHLQYCGVGIVILKKGAIKSEKRGVKDSQKGPGCCFRSCGYVLLL